MNTHKYKNETTLPPALTDIHLLKQVINNKWPLPNKHVGELLIEQKVLTPEHLQQALDRQLSTPHMHLGKTLIDMKLVDEDTLYHTLAFKLGMNFVKLQKIEIDSSLFEVLSYEQALKHHSLPIMFHDGLLVVATSNPTGHEESRAIEFITGHHLEMVVAAPTDLNDAIEKYYGQFQDAEDIVTLETGTQSLDSLSANDAKEVERLSQEKPIVRLVQHMLTEAVRQRASDIHVRPGEHKVDLIYRIDGTLITIKSFSPKILPAVVSRIKILGDMDISERRIPQDGRAKVSVQKKTIDLRISIMPTVVGESVVIRLLDTSSGLARLEDLGFDETNRTIIFDILNRSFGIFLVTGPTGSGKSTTLYSALNKLREKNVNIITVENPVEYHVDGIEQMQVNEKAGYSFARILRNILRHDPDVIMVGEIRDQETAKIAIESALTGHFVLSTLHTNSAAVTVTRLLEMGIEPYLICDTLLGVLAQRLVRKNCPNCLAEEEIDPHIYDVLGINHEEKFFRGRGCEQCNQTGYKGRQAVYELLAISPKLRGLISSQVSAENIQQQALEDGMVPLTDNALQLARSKATSLAEVYRVRLT